VWKARVKTAHLHRFRQRLSNVRFCRAADGSILNEATRLKRRWLNGMVRRIPGMTEKESFAGKDLRQATLDGRFYKMCDFRGADLRGASLRGTHFVGCDLRDADFRWADLTDAEFGYVMTHDPNYGLTDVTGANWQGACLERVTVVRVIGWPEG